MLKRRRADRADWERVTQRRFAHTRMDTPEFSGSVTLLCIDAVHEPLWIMSESQNLCLADAGYSWLQHFPTDQNFGVTTMFDDRGEVIQWYIDIVMRHCVDEDGVPFWDDLYLDIVVMPDGSSAILDEDELDDALRDGVISPAEHKLAWNVTHQIHAAIKEKKFPIFDLSPSHRTQLMAKLVQTDIGLSANL